MNLLVCARFFTRVMCVMSASPDGGEGMGKGYLPC